MDDLDIVYRSVVGDVYHTDPGCPSGRRIPPEWRVADAGELPVCPSCRARREARRARDGTGSLAVNPEPERDPGTP